MAGPDAQPDSAPTQFHHWKLLESFQRRLAPVLARRQPTRTELNPRRQLQPAGYFSLLLFGLLNPVLKTTRALCAATHFPRLQAAVGTGPVSLASFSDMQWVCEPEVLAGLLRELAAEARPVFGDARLQAQVQDLVATDGTLLPALPRMAWGLWQDARNRAGKLHLEFSVWRQVPSEFTVTAGNASERGTWEAKIKPGAFYVNDRHFGQDYKLVSRVQKAGAKFVLRLLNNTVLHRLEPARELTPADRAAGVVEDVRVRLGAEPNGPEGRLVRVEAAGHTFLLFTNQPELAAELVALIYRYRWQIELFFKWLKCILGCRHWLAESQAGVTLQVYCALIASVFLMLWAGSRPTKRQWEALQLYWLGCVGWPELERSLQRAKKAK